MKRKNRLTSSTDFKRVRRLGKSYAHPLVVLVVLSNSVETSRIGVAAGRAVRGAVLRNRAKRVLRATIDPYLPDLRPGFDLVLLARAATPAAKSQEVQQALRILLNQAHLLTEKHGN